LSNTCTHILTSEGKGFVFSSRFFAIINPTAVMNSTANLHNQHWQPVEVKHDNSKPIR